MSAISTTGARIDRWDNGRPAHREHARLVEALKLGRSSRYLYWAAFITFISEPHDEVPDLILAPYINTVVQAAMAGVGATTLLEADRQFSAGAPVELVTYPGAHHAFDIQIFQPGRMMFGHWTEYNAEAAEDARRRIRSFLADYLGK